MFGGEKKREEDLMRGADHVMERKQPFMVRMLMVYQYYDCSCLCYDMIYVLNTLGRERRQGRCGEGRHSKLLSQNWGPSPFSSPFVSLCTPLPLLSLSHSLFSYTTHTTSPTPRY